jgi:hypothetical protein
VRAQVAAAGEAYAGMTHARHAAASAPKSTLMRGEVGKKSVRGWERGARAGYIAVVVARAHPKRGEFGTSFEFLGKPLASLRTSR